MKYIRIILPIVLLAGFGFWMFSTLANNKELIDKQSEFVEEVVTEIPVRVARVERRLVDNSLELTGTFEARKELNIIAEGQGRLTALFIQDGDRIQKGAIVAKIDASSIEAQVQVAMSSLEKSENDLASYERLLKAGAISRQQYEDVKLAVKNAQASLASIEQQLNYTTVRSPMSGIVKEVFVEEGSFATPGSTIANIVDISKLKMVVKVSEEEVVKIKKGRLVDVATDVYPDHTFQGRISLIGIQADQGRKYDVEIEMANTGRFPLKPGMYGTVKIMTDTEAKHALFLPRKAILGSVKQSEVYVVEEGVSRLLPVEIGAITGEDVMLLSGLNEGDQVITTGQLNLDDGKRITIISDDTFSTSN